MNPQNKDNINYMSQKENKSTAAQEVELGTMHLL